MKKLIRFMAIVLSVLVAIVVFIGLLGIYKFNFIGDDIYFKNSEKFSFRDATYLIDGQSITFYDGLSEIDVTTNSTSKIITRYFGNEARGDLNGDGQEDVAFVITQNSGGSGVFFYVVVALADGGGYEGLNAVFLGDRIAPQTTEIKEGRVMINYADRKIDEPMTVDPSIAFSKYLQVVDGKLIEINVDSKIANRDWTWVKTLMNNDEIIIPKKDNVFIINFQNDGTFSGSTDCNNFFGNYEIINSGLSLGTMGSTKMFCEDSQESIFLESLAEVGSYSIDNNNNLLLELRFDSGVIIME